MKMSTLLKPLAGVCLAFLLFPQTAHAAGFVQDAMGVKYQNDDGSFLSDAWVQMGQNIYHLDVNGIVQTGWIQVDSLWYFLDEDGVCTNPAGTAAPPVDFVFSAEPDTWNETGDIFADAGWIPLETDDPVLLNNGIAAGLVGTDGIQYWAEPSFAAQIGATQAAAPEAAEITFALNRNTKKFHYLSCREVRKIKEKNRQDSGLPFDEIISMGYHPVRSAIPQGRRKSRDPACPETCRYTGRS